MQNGGMNLKPYAILHLSDLHIDSFVTKEKKKPLKSRMEDINYSRLFLSTLNALTEDFEIKQVIISGDLANEATKKEYDNVLTFLDNIKNELNLNSSEFLIVPGNHDINRLTLQYKHQEYIDNSGEIEPYMLHQEKLSKFMEFYQSFNSNGAKFNPTDAICNEIYISELNLLLIGINTLYKESFRNEDHVGYIDYECLKKQLEDLDIRYGECFKIAVFHHSPQIVTGHSEGSINNWPVIKELFDEHNINVYFYGHTHASLRDAKTNDEKNYQYVGCGSFALCDIAIRNFFNLYSLQDKNDNNITFKLITYTFKQGYEGKYGIGEWEIDDKKSGKVPIINSYSPNKMLSETTTLPESIAFSKNKSTFNSAEDTIADMLANQAKDIINDIEPTKSKYCDDILKIVSNKGLFKSGHFHWGENSRAHGWLDTNSLLSDYKCLKICINASLHLIQENSLNADLVIGIGMEGNILASPIAIALGAKYTYIPVATKEYNEFENKIEIDSFTNVLMITDTIFTGQTINCILNKNKEAFMNKNIQLISIFYTGHILDELSKKINYNYICNKIKIKSCTNQDYKHCSIYKNDLDTIYKF